MLLSWAEGTSSESGDEPDLACSLTKQFDRGLSNKLCLGGKISSFSSTRRLFCLPRALWKICWGIFGNRGTIPRLAIASQTPGMARPPDNSGPEPFCDTVYFFILNGIYE